MPCTRASQNMAVQDSDPVHHDGVEEDESGLAHPLLTLS